MKKSVGAMKELGRRGWHRGFGSMRLTFVSSSGQDKRVVEGDYAGKNILAVAHQEGIDLEGACEGSCACSTCHVILEPHVFEALPEPTEEEEDMLDLAFGLTETSRLGCQVTLTQLHDGMLIRLPSATRNMYVDGHVPQPH